MANKVSYYPGLEDIQQSAERKRKLADLLSKLAFRERDYRSPLQVLGQLAQAFASSRAGRKADDLDVQFEQERRKRIADAMMRIQAPNATPDEVADIRLNNPGIPEFITKPMDVASEESARWGARPRPEIHNDVVYDQRELQPGQILAQDPNKALQRLPDGSVGANPAAVTMEAIKSAARGGYLDPNTPISIPNYQDPNMAPPQTGINVPEMPSQELVEHVRKHPELLDQFLKDYPEAGSIFFGGQ